MNQKEFKNSFSHKFCKGCNIEKSNSNFNKSSKNKDGLQSYCKECSKLANRKNVNLDQLEKMIHEWKK